MEADGAGECIGGLALVEFGGCLAAERRLFQPVEGEQRTLDAADLAQCQRQAVLPWVGAEPLEHERGTDHAGAHRCCKAQQIIPVRCNQLFVRSTGDEWRKRRPGARRVEGIESSLGEVRNARGELEAEQMGECEDMVADPPPSV